MNKYWQSCVFVVLIVLGALIVFGGTLGCSSDSSVDPLVSYCPIDSTAVEARIGSLLPTLTLEEKASLMHGASIHYNRWHMADDIHRRQRHPRISHARWAKRHWRHEPIARSRTERKPPRSRLRLRELPRGTASLRDELVRLLGSRLGP